jgi:mono/diheme cytochrome c family protein
LILHAWIAAGIVLLGGIAIGQEVQTGSQHGTQSQPAYQNMTPEQRAKATRTFLGLGPEPDKEAAMRGAPLFQQNCAFCHGPQARGATGPSLLTSDEVLGDDHGEHLLPFLKKGRPEKGMPAFATMSDEQLKDVAEFMHLQVEDVANRGTYRVLNILVGNAEKGHTYVASHCMSCHSANTFTHLGSKFRSPDQLQRGWIWPAQHGGSANTAPAMTATVTTANGNTITGRVTEVSDFHITLMDQSRQKHVIARKAGSRVQIKDPLAAHQQILMTLSNDDMHNVTAYLDTLK